ncbi:hypothetical protein GC194_08390 [bacterium]|nr:hypothetical protein [bacterium]
MESPSRHILLCDHCPPFFIEALQNLNFSIDYQPEVENEDLFGLANIYDSILIKSSLLLNERFFEHFSQINLVFRPGSGLDNVDKDWCAQHQIRILNSPNGNSNAVGEHAMGLLLMLTNNMLRAANQVKNGQWIREENRGLELENKTVAVIGVGNAGSAFCEKLSSFNVKLLPHDKYKERVTPQQLPSIGLQTVYEQADVVSLHLPHNNETHYYANEAFFNAFEKPIIFLNTSRGKVCDTRALWKAIKEGRVLAAALDVIETEPLSKVDASYRELIDEMLLSGKVIITPHIAGWTFEALRKMFEILIDKYKQLL